MVNKAIKDKAKIRDCRIAAIAVAHDLKVITANVKDFVRIKRAIPVEYEDWSILSLH
jgi:predicted nucleic acid-binding protein